MWKKNSFMVSQLIFAFLGSLDSLGRSTIYKAFLIFTLLLKGNKLEGCMEAAGGRIIYNGDIRRCGEGVKSFNTSSTLPLQRE